MPQIPIPGTLLVRREEAWGMMDVAFSPERQQMTALNNFNEQIREFYQQAVACERQAGAQNDPKVKQQFLELKRLWRYWRSAASSIKPDECPDRRFPPPCRDHSGQPVAYVYFEDEPAGDLSRNSGRGG